MPKIAPADAAGAMAAAEAKGKELLKDAEARATAMAPEAMALAKAGAAAGNALFAKGQAAMFGSISEAGVPPPQVIQSPTLQFEGKMYHKRPKFQRPERSKLELSPCGLCCCWNPDQDMFYNDPATFMIFGEKDSKRCCGCCFCMTGPGYVGKEGNDTLGTLTPWMMPCCFCCQSTPQMVDPSDPEGKRKTWYVPTAHLAGPDGNPLYETRIRSPDLNCCASCKACCRCTPCKCCAGCALQCCTCKCQSCCDNFCGRKCVCVCVCVCVTSLRLLWLWLPTEEALFVLASSTNIFLGSPLSPQPACSRGAAAASRAASPAARTAGAAPARAYA